MRLQRLIGRLTAIADALDIETEFLFGEDEDAHKRVRQLSSLLGDLAKELVDLPPPADAPAPVAPITSFIEPNKLLLKIERLRDNIRDDPGLYALAREIANDVNEAASEATFWVPRP